MSWVAVGTAVASFVLNSQAQKSAQKKQQSLVDQMTQYRLGKSNEAQAAIKGFTDTQQPDAVAARTGEINSAITGQLNQALATAKSYEKPENVSGKFGPDYTNRNASNDARIGDQVAASIKNLAAIRTPGQRDFSDSLNLGVASTGVAGANSAANNVSGAYGTAIGNVRPDPFLSFAADLAKGVSIAKAGGKIQPGSSGVAPTSAGANASSMFA